MLTPGLKGLRVLGHHRLTRRSARENILDKETFMTACASVRPQGWAVGTIELQFEVNSVSGKCVHQFAWQGPILPKRVS